MSVRRSWRQSSPFDRAMVLVILLMAALLVALVLVGLGEMVWQWVNN